MYKRKNKYGQTTAVGCFFCNGQVTKRTKEGLEVCNKCIDKSSKDIVCPIHNCELELRNGKYGAYFFCWDCNKNWSKSQIQKWMKEEGTYKFKRNKST